MVKDRKFTDPRWQAFADDLVIRAMTFPLKDSLGALATRGLADKAPMSQRWWRVGLLFTVVLSVCGAGLAIELMLVRAVTGGR